VEPSKPSTLPPAENTEPEIRVSRDAKVLYTELGWASWYGPGFEKRRAANGEVFSTEHMTAAHRTLPLNSIARVTNVKTGESVLLRITDRGPFVSDRILDLSRAAARKLSVYQQGTALVRVEVLDTPSPIATGGRWCVQIGSFTDAGEASRLKDKLSRRYHTAKILQFSSPTGESWLRVRVAEDDKKRAQELMRETHTDTGIFLVRMD
jgi:rare lipoprotein A